MEIRRCPSVSWIVILSLAATATCPVAASGYPVIDVARVSPHMPHRDTRRGTARAAAGKVDSALVVLHGSFGALGLVLDVLGGGGAFLLDGGRR